MGDKIPYKCGGKPGNRTEIAPPGKLWFLHVGFGIVELDLCTFLSPKLPISHARYAPLFPSKPTHPKVARKPDSTHPPALLTQIREKQDSSSVAVGNDGKYRTLLGGREWHEFALDS